jgi:hypothetical protein
MINFGLTLRAGANPTPGNAPRSARRWMSRRRRGQSPARTSRSRSFASAPWRSISLTTLSRPYRPHREHVTSSIGKVISPKVTAP